MRIQPTRIEQLDRKHPGLRLEVDLLLDRGGRTPGQGTLEDVQKLLAQKYEEAVPINTISNYKQHRWLIGKLRLRELKETFRAVKDELVLMGRASAYFSASICWISSSVPCPGTRPPRSSSRSTSSRNPGCFRSSCSMRVG